jgi:hypothetical protein
MLVYALDSLPSSFEVSCSQSAWQLAPLFEQRTAQSQYDLHIAAALPAGALEPPDEPPEPPLLQANTNPSATNDARTILIVRDS